MTFRYSQPAAAAPDCFELSDRWTNAGPDTNMDNRLKPGRASCGILDNKLCWIHGFNVSIAPFNTKIGSLVNIGWYNCSVLY